MRFLDEEQQKNFTLGFDPLPIIMALAACLLMILIILCICGIKKALDIANQDKVIVFEGKVLLTESQLKNNRGSGIRNSFMRISQDHSQQHTGPILIGGNIQIGPVQKPQIEEIEENKILGTFDSHINYNDDKVSQTNVVGRLQETKRTFRNSSEYGSGRKNNKPKQIEVLGSNEMHLPPAPSVPRAGKQSKNVFSPKNQVIVSETTISPHHGGAVAIPAMRIQDENLDIYKPSQFDQELKLPPINKNYQYDWGATNNIYKKDKLKIARTIAKGEMNINEENFDDNFPTPNVDNIRRWKLDD